MRGWVRPASGRFGRWRRATCGEGEQAGVATGSVGIRKEMKRMLGRPEKNAQEAAWN
jgi:hypothetical protein